MTLVRLVTLAFGVYHTRDPRHVVFPQKTVFTENSFHRKQFPQKTMQWVPDRQDDKETDRRTLAKPKPKCRIHHALGLKTQFPHVWGKSHGDWRMHQAVGFVQDICHACGKPQSLPEHFGVVPVESLAAMSCNDLLTTSGVKKSTAIRW
jgi:hypothetical protein